jgi:hypothetical protein
MSIIDQLAKSDKKKPVGDQQKGEHYSKGKECLKVKISISSYGKILKQDERTCPKKLAPYYHLNLGLALPYAKKNTPCERA